MFRHVPVLPVVVPLGVIVLVALLESLRRRRSLSLPRATVAVALSVYVAGVVANTVFPIYLDKPGRDASWDDFLVLVPLADYEVADAAMNVAVFVPVGVLVPLVLVGASWGRVLAIAAASSLGIEVVQYATAHLLSGGHIADVNDLLFNVAGALAGFGALRLLTRISTVVALRDRFSWH
ncbi:VanZ family protein [Nocardioides sp. ChNu-153]|uniref:VanZ family protein n=1 Tax=unclassified Nocardioides TaxID=2615069 RepID=UPI00240700BD|nr:MULTISPECIES: VanZ family protein [unclassified Nocardioides]MDF9716773.1 VanZ family protein [Nocardioides sp. ChNu-99]MDN7121331.1 VanZ family protein [Nocardioides sp. ChNu-153]